MYNWLAMSFFCCYWKFKPPHCLWLRYLWRIYATYIFLIESTGSVRRCFRSEHEKWQLHPQGSLTSMREWRYKSGTLQHQRTMSFSYQAVSWGRNGRANLCHHKVSEWVTHLHIETNHKSRLGIYVLKNWFTVKVHYNIYCCCSTFVLS